MKGKNITLRAVEPADAPLMYEWENEISLWYVSGTTSPMPRFVIEEFSKIENQDVITTRQLRLVIELNSSRQTIGYVDLFDVDMLNRRAGTGILIGDKKQQGKGFAWESLQLLKNYAKQILNLHQLFCNIHQSNNYSIHLFEKAGFIKCGMLKEWALRDGSFEDVVVMQCFL